MTPPSPSTSRVAFLSLSLLSLFLQTSAVPSASGGLIADALAELPDGLGSEIQALMASMHMTEQDTHFSRLVKADKEKVNQSVALLKFPTPENGFAMSYVQMTHDLDPLSQYVALVCGHTKPSKCVNERKHELAPSTHPCGVDDAADRTTGPFCEVLALSHPATEHGELLVHASETRFNARNAALGAAVDFRVVSETHSCGLFSLSFSGNRRGRAAALPRCGGGIRAATVRPRTRLSRRGLRAFTERDGQESQRKTPPGCVSPALVAEPRPAPRAIRRFLGTAAAGADSRETMRRRRARRRANSLNDAFVIKRGRGRSRDVASRRRSRARLGDCLSRPRRERVTPRATAPLATPTLTTAALSFVPNPQTSSTTWRRSRATARARRSSSCN